MAGRTWQPSQSKKFARELKLGETYYVVLNIAHAKTTSWGEDQMYSAYTFTSRLPLTGNPCTDSGYSAETLCRQFGPVYDTPPHGMHNIADKAPNDFAPSRGYGGPIADWV